jgi:hypothetical protein
MPVFSSTTRSAIDVLDAILVTVRRRTRRSGHMNITKNGNMVRRASSASSTKTRTSVKKSYASTTTLVK